MVTCDGVVELPISSQRVAQTELRTCERRRDFQSPTVAFNRTFNLPISLQRHRQVVMNFGIIRQKFGRLLQRTQCIFALNREGRAQNLPNDSSRRVKVDKRPCLAFHFRIGACNEQGNQFVGYVARLSLRLLG